MKKTFQFYTLLVTLLFTACTSLDYIEKDYQKNVEKLQASQPYNSKTGDFQNRYMVEEEQASIICKYFKENAGLDLEALAASEKSTWEKSLELAVFVAKNVPHDNQKEWLDDRSAISLWEYSRRVKTGFNCRWHSILLSELLLSAGIKNRFITCLPQDLDDGDCHVVNIVWLPELNKWAMIDSDMVEFVTDDKGIPLSLAEMREEVIAGKPLNINVLPGFEDSWVARPSGLSYMQAYWAKNLYWFTAHSTIGFNLEGSNRTLPDTYTALVPPDFDCSKSYKNGYETSNEANFWDIEE